MVLGDFLDAIGRLLVTMMPACVAASRSMVSTPMP
jgi:hypothetical protein